MASNINQKAFETKKISLTDFQNAIANLNNKIVQEKLLQRYSIESNYVEIQRNDAERAAESIIEPCADNAAFSTVRVA